jgi:DNA (cytosine-5)-methyltransferase 1
MVGFDKKVFNNEENFSFPDMPPAEKKVKHILKKDVDPKYTLSDKLWNYLQAYAKKHKENGNGFGFGLADPNGITRTMSARYYKDGAEILIAQAERNPRRLIPQECAILQGYPDSFRIPVSDNQAYKQFGNSVVVPLIEAIGERVIHAIETSTKK